MYVFSLLSSLALNILRVQHKFSTLKELQVIKVLESLCWIDPAQQISS